MNKVLKLVREIARYTAMCLLCIFVIIVGTIGSVFHSIQLWNMKALNALMNEEEYQKIKRRDKWTTK